MKKNTLLYVKGIFIGLADLVPGVSGGTIALLTGIYPRLIGALAKADLFLPLSLFSADKRKYYDVSFLLLIGLGVITGILGGVGLMHYLLQNFSPPLFAFFGGLILAALVTGVPRVLKKSRFMFVLGLVAGIGFSFAVGVSLGFQPVFIFLAGMLAACVMLLPGISGSFVLLLLGIYRPLIAAVAGFDWMIIFVFAAGVLLGILSFSRILNVLIARYRANTMALMLGLMGGALPRLWPWQAEQGGEYSLLLPDYYESVLQQPAYVVPSIVTFLCGMLVLFFMGRSAG